MKIGAKVVFFNYKMREARIRLGLTQKQLADLAGDGICVNDIGLIERLCNFPGYRMSGRNEKLCKIARALQMDFDELFPQEYLDMLQKEVLPRRTNTFLWVKEVSLEQLVDKEQELEAFLLDDPLGKVIEQQEISAALRDVLSSLPKTEQMIIDMRYGLSNGKGKTMNEVACILGVTVERIRQIENKALAILRHPVQRRKLRDFLAI